SSLMVQPPAEVAQPLNPSYPLLDPLNRMERWASTLFVLDPPRQNRSRCVYPPGMLLATVVTLVLAPPTNVEITRSSVPVRPSASRSSIRGRRSFSRLSMSLLAALPRSPRAFQISGLSSSSGNGQPRDVVPMHYS